LEKKIKQLEQLLVQDNKKELKVVNPKVLEVSNFKRIQRFILIKEANFVLYLGLPLPLVGSGCAWARCSLGPAQNSLRSFC